MMKFSKKYFNNNIPKKSNLLLLTKFNSTFEKKSTINKSNILSLTRFNSTFEKKSILDKIVEKERNHGKSGDFLNTPLNYKQKSLYMGQYAFGKLAYTAAIVAPILIFMSPSTDFIHESCVASTLFFGLGYCRHMVFPGLLAISIFIGCVCVPLVLLDKNRKDIKKFMYTKIKRITE